ncbi:MAG: hypothetical protein ACYC9O_01225 [Candidatus Latescibacterota bacterium]
MKNSLNLTLFASILLLTPVDRILSTIFITSNQKGNTMKKLTLLMAVMMLAFSSFAFAGNTSGPLGPNPQAGDGISDGSTLDSPNGPNADETLSSLASGTDDASVSGPMGPNPQAGDGIPDGSDLESPHGPNDDGNPE